MTIQIFNNSTDHDVYPVLSAGAKSDTDTWLQAYFRLTEGQLAANPYPRAGVYRMYINCCNAGEKGIPAGGSVTISLPLYSPLAATIDPTKSGQLIDWWQGGDINIYQTAKDAGSPPPLLQAHFNSETASQTPTSGAPTCTGCSLHIFAEDVSLPNNDPQQLIEYTLGAQPLNPRRGQSGEPYRLFVANNVDYDVSYVNNAYLPALMEPYGNPLIGYVGAPNDITGFMTKIGDFLKSADLGQGWPVYKDSAGATIATKPASALDFFLNFNDAKLYDPNPPQSPPVMRMQAMWQECTGGKTTDPVCPLINDVTDLLKANYANYTAKFHSQGSWNCTGSPAGPLTDQLLLAHLYGWGPFSENCASDANLLQDTPGYEPSKSKSYAAVKNEFDHLQYWDFADHDKSKYGTYQFHPYVGLIHGSDFINAPYVYAYSVDDAVGNMQTDGTGLIIAVGGPANLPNPDHATPDVHFNYGYETKYPSETINFAQYGRCTATPDATANPDFASFPIPLGIDGSKSSIVNCPVSFVDNTKRSYQLKITKPPPWPTNPGYSPEGHSFIDCGGNTNPQVQGWCNAIWVYQQTLDDSRATTVYNVQIGAPPPSH